MDSTVSPEETDQDSESGPGCLNEKEDLTHSFEVVLKDLPEVLIYIKRLNEHIKKQQSTLVRLFEKLKEYKNSSCTNVKCEVKDASTQTDSQPEEQPSIALGASSLGRSKAGDQCSEWTIATGVKSGLSIADEVKKVAESAMQQTGFAYEETSGMYYDYNTGYYYNAEMGLYYDGNSGTYLFYNEGTRTYEFHSQAALPAPALAAAAAPTQIGLPEIPGVSAGEDVILASIERLAKEKAATAALVVPDIEPEVMKKSVKSVLVVVPDKPVTLKAKSSKSFLVQSDKVTDIAAEAAKPTDRMTECKMKSDRPTSSLPDPLETKEADLLMPGSNPMAPVISETRNEDKSPKESRHEHKRKGKHKKHKSKKKKKKRHRSTSRSERHRSTSRHRSNSRHRSTSRSENSLEEGELSGSSESEKEKETHDFFKSKTYEENPATKEVLSANDSNVDVPDVQPARKKQRTMSDEASEAWPPCMRIIVQSTEVKNLSVGTLFIVTCKGGTLGREKFHAVSIPDINISKHHGIFKFLESDGNYYLTDYGSRNGTFVNEQRLSSAKQESEPCEIPHGTVIRLGSTVLLCHIHPGRETCEECEPGVVAAKKVEDYESPLPCSNIRESKSEKRLQELRRLRKRFGLESSESKGELAPGYEDRAEIRRVTVGSHNEHAKTEMSSTRESIKASNKGFKMLAKMGWKEGESLGKDGTGLTEPVLVEQRADKAGLGSEAAFAAPVSTTARARQRADKWQLARQRYGQLPETIHDEVILDD